jgi:hypothetical protein
MQTGTMRTGLCVQPWNCNAVRAEMPLLSVGQASYCTGQGVFCFSTEKLSMQVASRAHQVPSASGSCWTRLLLELADTELKPRCKLGCGVLCGWLLSLLVQRTATPLSGVQTAHDGQIPGRRPGCLKVVGSCCIVCSIARRRGLMRGSKCPENCLGHHTNMLQALLPSSTLKVSTLCLGFSLARCPPRRNRLPSEVLRIYRLSMLCCTTACLHKHICIPEKLRAALCRR